MNKGEVWFVEFPLELLPKDSFIFKIGDLNKEDLQRIADMYDKFLSDAK